MLRCVRVQQQVAADAAARIKVASDGPTRPARRDRFLYLNRHDFEVIHNTTEFEEFNESSFGFSQSRGPRIPHGSDASQDESTLQACIGANSVWIHAIPDEEEGVFVVKVQALLANGLRDIALNSDKLQCTWRLSKAGGRLLPETLVHGVNNVEVDGIIEAQTPDCFQLDLMSHQRRSLAWMLRRERFGAEELLVSEQRYDRPLGCLGLDLRLEIRSEELMSLRGGLLCDVMGSGKTATVLALVLSNSTHSFIPAHARVRDVMMTRATLVLCPANVHAQWLAEAKKFCPPSLRVVSLQTPEDVLNHDLELLLNADLVVSPYDIFAVSPPASSLTLERLSWHRIVLDEFHELTSRSPPHASRNDQILNALRSIHVEKRWALSGTPEAFLTSPASIANASRFFHCDFSIRSAPYFVEHCCRRARVVMPVQVQEHVVEVLQTPAERVLYLEEQASSPSYRNLLVACSHFTTAVHSASAGPGPLSAAEICDKMRDKKADDVTMKLRPLKDAILSTRFDTFETRTQDILDLSCGNVDPKARMQTNFFDEAHEFHDASCKLQLVCTQLVEADVRSQGLADALMDIQQACMAVQTALERLMAVPLMEKPLQNDKDNDLHSKVNAVLKFAAYVEESCGPAVDAHRRLFFFEKAQEVVNDTEHYVSCPVCLEDVYASSAYILFCGHMLCGSCAPEIRRRSNARCPVCRFELRRLHNLPDAVPPQDPVLSQYRSDASKAEAEGTRHWSSKLCSLTATLEQIHLDEPRAKVIVFTQWESLRLQISSALMEIGVTHLLLEGSIFERTRVLQAFQSDENTSLLLLSLEQSASGTNLTVANHVFLMHPMLASSEAEAVSFEAQAIGRVVRMGQTRPVHIWRFVTAYTLEQDLFTQLTTYRASAADPSS